MTLTTREDHSISYSYFLIRFKGGHEILLKLPVCVDKYIIGQVS
jgi:hypothetical protein